MLSNLKNFFVLRAVRPALVAAVGAVLALAPGVSAAGLKCERLTSVCTDSATRISQYGEAIPTPVMYNGQACWSWSNTYRCVEANPTYTCTGGGAQAGNVMTACAMVAGTINSTISVNGLSYVTSADYQYACEFPTKVDAQPPLPGPPKECVRLETHVDYTSPTAADVAQVAQNLYIVGSKEANLLGATLAAKSNTAPSTGVGNPPTVTAMNEVINMTRTFKSEFVCYDPPVEVCADTCYSGSDVVASGRSNIDTKPVACPTPLDKSACTIQTDVCDGTKDSADVGSGRLEQGPDGRCVASTAIYHCPSKTAPACLNLPNCTLVDSQWSVLSPTGVPLSMEQTYECTKTETKCDRVSSVNSCSSVETWGLDKWPTETKVGEGLKEANVAMAKVEGIQKGLKEDDIYIFSGQDLRCRYPVGSFLNSFLSIAFSLALAAATGGFSILGTLSSMAGFALSGTTVAAVGAALSIAMDAPNSKAFGTNCCKDYVIEGSDAWYKLGSCSADEVKLAVARSKHLEVKIGDDYCSKRSGFPIRECKEKTKTYCAFDDMLALTVNEQGRAQLDRIVSAQTVSTSTSEDIALNMFSYEASANTGKYYTGMNTGHWSLVTTLNGSVIYSWQYPAYCKNPSTQAQAFSLYVKEVNQAADMTGFIPPKDANGKYILTNLSPDQKKQIAEKLLAVPSFQECPTMPGTMTFMTCATGSSCDVKKMPTSPAGLEFDELGQPIGAQPDPNWRTQQVRSFYEPTTYGVTQTMPSNPDYAKVSSAISEVIAASGSCKEGVGDCLYNFSVTTGGGAPKMLKEVIKFPLYSFGATEDYPTIDYMPLDGSLPSVAYRADPNRGIASPVEVGRQRYIFHPILQTQAPASGMHPAVLLEWAYKAKTMGEPRDDYEIFALPTKLPPNTSGWWPKIGSELVGDSLVPAAFYISGGCDPLTKWCQYEVQQELKVERHPWGTNTAPRCWGFSLEQMAVLDFDSMDLSRWINSLDLDGMASGMPSPTKTAMAGQVTASAQTFYNSMSTGSETKITAAENQALVLSSETLPLLSGPKFEAYKLHVAVPANWPKYYRPGEGNNDNAVSNAVVDFGRSGINTNTQLVLDPSGKFYEATADLGDYPVGTYKVTVKLNTARSGEQVLSQYVRVTPYYGAAPSDKTMDFGTSNINAPTDATYKPSELANGTLQTSEGIKRADGSIANNALSNLYKAQGATVNTAVPE